MTIPTILVMGPPGSGKSDFVKVLAGPVKLKRNATITDELRSLAITPYFTDAGDIIRLIKFPGFNHLSPESNPTDAELLIDLSVYLEGMRRRQELISGIIYTHRIDDEGLDCFEVKRNLKMLLAIAGDKQTLQNVVIVTTGWDKPSAADRNAKETKLKELFTKESNIDPAQFMEHDGSKWSALRIVEIVKGKPPTLLYIQTELEKNPNLSYTKAAVEILGDIDTFLLENQKEDGNLRAQIRRARSSRDQDSDIKLTKKLDQLTVVIRRLKDEDPKLQAPVNWDQASRDNVQLEEKITEMHDLATRDWKAEYERMKNEADNFQTRYNTAVANYNSMKANNDNLQTSYNTVVNERNALQTNYNSVKASYDALVVSSRSTTSSATNVFSTSLNTYKIRATGSRAWGSAHQATWPEWLDYSAGEIMSTNGVSNPTPWGNVYRVHNRLGRTGVVYASDFAWV